MKSDAKNNYKIDVTIPQNHKKRMLCNYLNENLIFRLRDQQNGGHIGFLALTSLAQGRFFGILWDITQDTSENIF